MQSLFSSEFSGSREAGFLHTYYWLVVLPWKRYAAVCVTTG